MEQELYLVDWGEGVKGSRYAIVEGRSHMDAFRNLDSIADPSDAKIKLINTNNLYREPFYVELSESPFYKNLNDDEDEEFVSIANKINEENLRSV